MTNERKENLGNGVYIFISNKYHFTTDSILLADFASPRRKDKILEIGSGCGIIPLIWCRDENVNYVDTVEIQKGACDLFKQSILINQFENKIHLFNADINAIYKTFTPNYYDIIVCNPPYKKVNAGISSDSDFKKIAHHEYSCNLNDVVSISYRLLKYGGDLVICNRIERFCDVINCMHENNIEPKLIRLVQQRINTPSKLFLIRGKKGAKSGVNFLPTLVITHEDGKYTQEMEQIYGSYRN